MKTWAEIEAEIDADYNDAIETDFEIALTNIETDLDEADRSILWQIYSSQATEEEQLNQIAQLDDRLQSIAMQIWGYERES